ncbi:formyltransferase family protein [Aureivirga marina]|uniref:formyltransferase family protein n=1 Tax=Aureivirga marina TaxID=1182451 RepID=UPI0018C8E6F8|nr:formyltransferase family protein [Aureivirga marina]
MNYYKQIIIIGAGKIALECLKEVENKFENTIGVVLYEDNSLSSFRVYADKKEYIVCDSTSKKDIDTYFNSIEENTLIISANNNFLFTEKIINKENLTIINFHNALLPSYKGRNAQTWVIFNEEKKTGITWHLVNEKVDDGRILIQKEIPLDTKITAIKLTNQLMVLGIKCFKELLPKLLNSEKISFTPIELFPLNDKIYYSKKMPNNGILDLEWSIDKISAFLRSLDYSFFAFFPSSKVSINGEFEEIKSYKILKLEDPIQKKEISISSNKVIIKENNLKIEINCNER